MHGWTQQTARRDGSPGTQHGPSQPAVPPQVFREVTGSGAERPPTAALETFSEAPYFP